MANEIKQIATTGSLTTVPALLASINNTNYAEGVVIGNQQDRTSGNVFIWKATGTANGGTVYAGSTGFWHMQYDQSFIDVKWFGAKGDWTVPGSGTNDTAAIQTALDYAAANNLNIYISKGKYKIKSPTSTPGADALTLTLTAASVGRIVIYGAGTEEASLVYDDTVAIGNVLKITKTYNDVAFVSIHDFEVRGNSFTSRLGTGIYIGQTYPLNVKNMSFFGLNLGIRLDAINNAKFEQCLIKFCSYAFRAETVNTATETLPNVLDFISCQFLACDITAVTLVQAHSANFLSCDVSYNGGLNTPALTVVPGIDMTYMGQNGGNGLNVTNCYFEANFGLADIRLQVLNPGGTHTYYGTHTFTGNTFNRNRDKFDPPLNNNPVYTTNNILVSGTGQYIKPTFKPVFGQGKSRLVFKGNGFFVNIPGALNNYVPSAGRRAIKIDYFNNNYWEFDIVEEGNTYAGLVDAPIHAPRVFDDKTPQVSEYTRPKAFGYFIYNTESRSYDIRNSYNIERIIINDRPPGIIGEEPEDGTALKGSIDSGSISILFANELQTIPLPVMLNHDEPEASVWGVIHSFRFLQSTGVTLDIYDFNTKARVHTSFVLIVF